MPQPLQMVRFSDSFGLGTILGNERCNPGLGRGGGLVVSVLAIYSENPSSNRADYGTYNFSTKRQK